MTFVDDESASASRDSASAASGGDLDSPRTPSDGSDGSDEQLPDSFHGISLKAFNPTLIPAIPPPEAFRESPHYPVVVTQNPFAASQQAINGSSSVSDNILDINRGPMEVDSELLSGKVEMHIRGVKSTQPGKFDGKKRCVHVVLQARFKRPTLASEFCIGQEMFSEAAIPIWLSEALLTAAARTFSNTTRVSARTTPRYFMNPVMAACQLINVSRPGQEPGLWDAKEDVRLLLPGATTPSGAALSSDARRKWCDVPANIDGARFDPGHVYTFHFYQHYADFANYKLSIGFLNVDLAPVLHRCPLQLTAKDVSTGLYAFSVLAWNERALYGAGGKAAAAEAAASAEAQLKQPAAGAAGLGSRLLSGMRAFGGRRE